MDKVHPKVEEAIDTLNMSDSPTRRRLLKGTGLVSATAAASALLAACSSSSSAAPPAAAAKEHDRGLPEDPRVAVLVRQPRHHQPVLRADPVRLRRRRRAARPAQAQVGRLGIDLESSRRWWLPDQRAVAAKAAGIATV
jgi:hypothetical protein